jgi:hypothetical protein
LCPLRVFLFRSSLLAAFITAKAENERGSAERDEHT